MDSLQGLAFGGTNGTVGGQVVRVALMTLKNLLTTPGVVAGPEMVEVGLQKVVAQRKLQVCRAALLLSSCCCNCNMHALSAAMSWIVSAI